MTATQRSTQERLTRESFRRGTTYLRRRDPLLREWIDRVGEVGLRRHSHQFGALCKSILSQQLAAAAARTIHDRFLQLFQPARRANPEALLALSTADLRACGISNPKVRYLRSLAEAYHSGPLRRVRLGARSDADVIDRLTQVQGIGVWTAEMFLIFSLGRIDVFSVGDLALRNAVQRVVGREMSPAEIVEVAERWTPYRSVASLYLWKIAHWAPE